MCPSSHSFLYDIIKRLNSHDRCWINSLFEGCGFGEGFCLQNSPWTKLLHKNQLLPAGNYSSQTVILQVYKSIKCVVMSNVTVKDDKQSRWQPLIAGFPKHRYRLNWLNVLSRKHSIIKSLRCEQYPKHFGRVTRPSGEKSNEWSLASVLRIMTQLWKAWHTPFTTLTTSQLPEKCVRSKWSTAHRISSDRRVRNSSFEAAIFPRKHLKPLRVAHCCER